MSRTWLFVAAGLVALLVISMVFGNRIAAGAGAALLLGTIIYVTLAQRGDEEPGPGHRENSFRPTNARAALSFHRRSGGPRRGPPFVGHQHHVADRCIARRHMVEPM